MNERLFTKPDNRVEAVEYDKLSIGLFKEKENSECRGGYRQNHDIRTLLKIVPHPLTTRTILKVHTVQQPNRKLLVNYSLQIENEATFYCLIQLHFTHGDTIAITIHSN